MSGSGKSLLGVWLYRRGKSWAVKEGSPLHKAACDISRSPYIVWFYSFMQIAENNQSNENKNSVIFSLKNQVGGLARALQVFQAHSCLIEEYNETFREKNLKAYKRRK